MLPYHAEIGKEPCNECGSQVVNKYDGRCIRCSRERHTQQSNGVTRAQVDNLIEEKRLERELREIWEE